MGSDENAKTENDKGAKIEQDKSDVNSLRGTGGIGEDYLTTRGYKYKIMPAALGDIPALQDCMSKYDASSGKLTAESVDSMVSIIMFGVKEKQPGITEDTIKHDFGLADFPVMLNKTLQMNDFLAKTREMKMSMAITKEVATEK